MKFPPFSGRSDKELQTEKSKAMKRFLFYITGLLVLLQTASCVQETEITPAPAASTRSVQFELQASANAATRALNSNEDVEVNNIYMLAFTEKSGVYEYAYTPAVSNVSITNGSGTFDAVLRTSSDNQKFLIIANPGTLASSVLPQSGETYDGVTARLEQALATRWPAKLDGSSTFSAIPMCANTGAVVVDKNTSTLGPLQLVRMLARIDVSLAAALTTPSEVFKLTGVYLFRPYKSGLVHYNTAPAYWSPIGDGGSVTTAHALKAYVPTGVEKVAKADYFTYTVPTADKYAFRNSIYMFEALGVTDMSQATAIVIGGEKGSDPGNVRYYRIDIKTLPDDATLPSGYKTADILRNFWYDIVINSVNGDGSDTPIEAYDGDFTVNATVTPYNQAAMKTIIDKQYRLTVDPLNLEFQASAGQQIVTAETDYNRLDLGFPAGIQVDETEIKYTPAVTSGNEWITLSNENGTSPGDLVRKIGVNVLANPGGSRSAKIFIKAGNMTQVVSVVQKGFFLRIVDASDNPITELAFNSKNSLVTAGTTPVSQTFKVEWAPADRPLAITKTTASGTNAFTWQDGSTNALTTLPAGGSYTFTIDPAALTQANLDADPFYEKISTLKFTLDDGTDTADASIKLSQINYALLAENFLHGNNTVLTRTGTVKANAAWEVSLNDPSFILSAHSPESGGENKNGVNFGYTFVGTKGRALFTFSNPYGLFDEVVVAVVDGSIAPYFARSNVVLASDGTLTFAVTEEDTKTIPSNVQGLLFRRASLFGLGNPAEAFNAATDIVFTPSEYTGIIPTTWAEMPLEESITNTVLTYDEYIVKFAPTGYDAPNGKGDVCRYISGQAGWTKGKWRMPTAAELQILYYEALEITGSIYGISIGSFSSSEIFTDDATGMHLTQSGWWSGLGVHPTNATATHMELPATATVFFPATGKRNWATGNFMHFDYGFYWSATPSLYSSTPRTNASYYMTFDANGYVPVNQIGYAVEAMAIRCIQETY